MERSPAETNAAGQTNVPSNLQKFGAKHLPAQIVKGELKRFLKDRGYSPKNIDDLADIVAKNMTMFQNIAQIVYETSLAHYHQMEGEGRNTYFPPQKFDMWLLEIFTMLAFED